MGKNLIIALLLLQTTAIFSQKIKKTVFIIADGIPADVL
jgi:hypothetical protein